MLGALFRQKIQAIYRWGSRNARPRRDDKFTFQRTTSHNNHFGFMSIVFRYVASSHAEAGDRLVGRLARRRDDGGGEQRGRLQFARVDLVAGVGGGEDVA